MKKGAISQVALPILIKWIAIIIIWMLFSAVQSIGAFFLEMTSQGLFGYLAMIGVLIFIAMILIAFFKVGVIKVILGLRGR